MKQFLGVTPEQAVEFFRRRGEVLRLHTVLKYGVLPWQAENFPTDEKAGLIAWMEEGEYMPSGAVVKRFMKECEEILKGYRRSTARVDLLQDAVQYMDDNTSIFGYAKPDEKLAWNEFMEEAGNHE